MGSDLYNKLTDYFKRHIARLRKVRQAILLIAFVPLIDLLFALSNAKPCRTSR